MHAIRAILVPVLILSLLGSGTALAWMSACCVGQGDPSDFSQPLVASVPAVVVGGGMDLSAAAPSDSELPQAADCGVDESASGLCCLSGVMSQPAVSVAIATPPQSWQITALTKVLAPPPLGLLRPPQA